MIDIRQPGITAATEREQLLQMRSYLYQLAQQLQYAFNAIESTGISGDTTTQDAQESFASIKGLIIRSTDISTAIIDKTLKRLEGMYVEVGTYAEHEKSVATQLGNLWAQTATPWESLGLSESVTEPAESTGRAQGCAYRSEGGHVYVDFCCGATLAGESITANAAVIPEGKRPGATVRSICPGADGTAVTIAVTPEGLIQIEPPTGAESTTLSWIDGHIDYWV